MNDEGTKVFVDDNDGDKIKRSGFLITGRDATKGGQPTNYFTVNDEGTKVFVDDELDSSDKARRSGFVVTGRTATKDGETTDYMKVATDGTQIKFDNDASKIKRRGFLITGRDATKGKESAYMTVNPDSTKFYVDDFNIDLRKDAITVNTESRMNWYPDKNTFMVGGSKDAENVGEDAFTFGKFAQAKGVASYAFGVGATASADSAFAIGDWATSAGVGAAALGYKALASKKNSLALGAFSNVNGDYSTAMGYHATATGGNSMALGCGTTASGEASVALGYNATSGQHSTSLGCSTTASGENSVALGYNATAIGRNSIALGNYSTAYSFGEVAIGSFNTSRDQNNPDSWWESDNLFVIGNGQSEDSKSDALIVSKNGNMTVNGSITYTGSCSSSDMRLKKDVESLDGALDKVLKLRGVTFYWKNKAEMAAAKGKDVKNMSYGFSDEKQIGVIAQEVEEVLPELVVTDNEGFKAVKYENLTPVLIEAVKELKAEKDELQKEVEELKRMVEELMKR